MRSHASLARRGPVRLLVPSLIAAFLLALTAERPEPVDAAGATSQTIVALVSHVVGLTAHLTSSERRLLPRLNADIAKLKADAARAARTHDEKLAAQVQARLNTLSRQLVGLPAGARQDEFGVRTEPDLGNPDCPPPDLGVGYCAGDGWLSTRSPDFVNIRKHAFLDGSFEYPQGVRVNASFVAERNDTTMAALFSAEAYVKDDVAGADRRMKVRALIDGKPAAPSDVVFASTSHQGTRQMLFTAKVNAGIHTVEVQWKMDDGATGYLSNANLLVRTGTAGPSDKGTLAATTPKSGANLVKSTAVWADVPGTNLFFWAPKEGVATVTFAAEASVSNGKAIAVRALIDNAVIAPSDVVFAKAGDLQTRGFTFGRVAVPEGWHSAKVQWFVEEGGTGQLGDRSVAVAAYPSFSFAPTHPFIAAPSGPNLVLPIDGIQPLPGMTTPINIPATGNGEVAVIFSAEVVSTVDAQVMLGVDGSFKIDTLTHLTDGTIAGQSKSYVLEAKGLAPGLHTLDIFVGGGAGKTQFGDRSIAVVSETGYVPDLAEAPTLTGGRVLTKHVGGIEPLIGPHNVLTILFDPYDCASGEDGCFDENSFSAADMTQALYGAGESTNGYFGNVSGGRFSITNAGVLGWYHAAHPASYYWDKDWETCDFNGSGFSSGHAARLSEAVQAAKDDIDFASFDLNRDGEIEQHELAIIVVFPGPSSDGSSLAELLLAQCPNAQRLSVDNVTLPRWITGWFANLDETIQWKQYNVAAHELMHQFSALDDIYVDSGQDHATFPRGMTLMSSNTFTSTHLDPVEKLALGWVTPRLVDDDLQIGLTRVEQSNRVLVLPRYEESLKGEEYFVLENRQQSTGFNGYFDYGIQDSGIAVWHAISDPAEAAKHPIGVTQTFWDTTAAQTKDVGNGTMGRWGIRLLRPWVALTTGGVAVFPDADNNGNPDTWDTLWDKSKYVLKSGVCPAVFLGENFAAFNVLAWADCTASGYSVKNLSAPGNTMTVKITH